MTPIQQLMLGLGAAQKKVYLDEVFNARVSWRTQPSSNADDRKIVNNIDLSTEGGLVWRKLRNGATNHVMVDTIRGNQKYLISSSNAAEATVAGGDDHIVNSWNTDGFTVGRDYGNAGMNSDGSGHLYLNQTFRKAPGFFDIVTWTGNSDTNQTINHSLGSIPGCIMAKRRDSTGDWTVYHRGAASLTQNNSLKLNESEAANNDNNWQEITSTSFRAYDDINAENATYVAYIFAGGESTAATARSVDFDGSDSLTTTSSSDLDFGTGDFTVEFWYRGGSYTPSSDRQVIIAANNTWGSGFHQIRISDVDAARQNRIIIWDYDTDNSAPIFISDQVYLPHVWRHVAITRTGGKLYVYVNGTLDKSISYTAAFNLSGGQGAVIGYNPTNTGFVGEISNLRVVKGTAVYTSSFRVPTEPLTNITNTKLLCCNNSSVTGSTVTPTTISSSGDPTARTYSPFDDPAGFKFGESGKESIITCGSHKNSSTTEIKIHLGWAPQWVLIKNSDASGNWGMFNTKSGMYFDSDGPTLVADANTAENGVMGQGNQILKEGNGFVLKYGLTSVNPGNGNKIIYIAIREEDGYVSKPPATGTDAFNIDTGNGTSGGPNFDATFDPDFVMKTSPGSSSDKYIGSRYTGKDYVIANKDEAHTQHNDNQIDLGLGWGSGSQASAWQSWMWRKGKGCDVICYDGDGKSQKTIAHTLGQVPEMIWTKNRDDSDNWICYHKGLNGGTNPWTKFLKLNESSAEATDSTVWNDTAPTATHFTVGNADNMNTDGEGVMAILFGSVDGISKVGYYSGSDSSHTITTGFQPRFLLIKNMTSGVQWTMFDTTRGWTSGAQDYQLYLSHANAHTTVSCGHPVSNGFYLDGDNSETSKAGSTFLYYAHA